MAKTGSGKGTKKPAKKKVVRATATPETTRETREARRTEPDGPGASVPDYEAHPNEPPTRRSDRPEFDDSVRLMKEGMSSEAAAVDEEESFASLGSADRSITATAAGTATGLGIDRGVSTGTGGLVAGEDLDPVAAGDWDRQLLRSEPYEDVTKPYEDFEPGYRFGWETSTDDRFAGRSFDEVEDELERQWADRRGENAHEWGDVRDEVRAAWDKARGREAHEDPGREERGA